MIKLLKIGLVSLFITTILIPWQAALADTGPKPTMEFTFTQDAGEAELSITSGELLECDQPDCADAQPLPELGPQGFRCEIDTCSAMAYGFSDYHKLSIQFSDGVTRESNVFKTAGFDSVYTVTVGPSDLQVNPVSHFSLPPLPIPYVMVILCGLVAMGLLIVIVVMVVLLVRRSRAK
jgi:hypothetical protein